MMGLLGLVLGVLGGILITQWFNINGFSYPGMDAMADQFNLPAKIYPQVSLLSAMLGPTIVFAGSLIASVYPAVRLHWLQLVAAMRSA